MQILFNLNINHLRKKKGLSQSDLANVFGVTNSLISLLESGRSLPSFQLLVSISEYFNINLNDLVYTDLSTEDLSNNKVSLSSGGNKNEYDLNKIAMRLESMLTQLEERIKKECPDCAKKLGL
jgi:transcriptional regulator with XRE-family HTH domain